MKKSLLFTTIIIIISFNAYSEEKSPRNQERLKGIWGWNSEQCENNPISISFKEDGSVMFFDTIKGMHLGDINNPIKRIRYVIKSERSNVLSTSIIGEDRLDKKGQPVAWDLIIQSKDRFCWRRADWAEGSCTQSMIRCN